MISIVFSRGHILNYKARNFLKFSLLIEVKSITGRKTPILENILKKRAKVFGQTETKKILDTSVLFNLSKVKFGVFLLNLLGWHWLIKLCRFQAYSCIIHHLYIVLCIHHSKTSPLPSPFVSNLHYSPSPNFPFPLVITILLCGSIHCCFSGALSLQLFHPAPLLPSPFTSVSLFSVSRSLFLFWEVFTSSLFFLAIPTKILSILMVFLQYKLSFYLAILVFLLFINSNY